MITGRNLYIPYYNHLQFLEWLIDDRDSLPEDKNAHLQSINITILINCCMVLEGFLYTIVKDYLFITQRRLNKEFKIEELIHPTLFTKILNDYSAKLDEGTWSGYIKLFELFTDCLIDKSNELWKATNILFSLRNYLVHGNEIEFIITGESKEELIVTSNNKNLSKILSYYLEKKLLHMDKEKVQVSILTSKAIDHFYVSMNQFAVHIFELIPENKRTLLTIDMFMFKEAIEKYAILV